MDELIKDIKDLVLQKDVHATDLDVTLAIEHFIDKRNYPTDWDDLKRLEDILKHKSKVAMATIEINAKEGVENQLSDSENSHSRVYADYIMAYANVFPYVNVVS